MRTLPLTLQTRVGRRIATLFVISALLPILMLAVLGYFRVRGQLLTQTRQQLGQAAKSVGMGLLDQLHTARAAAEDVATGGLGAAQGPGSERLRESFGTLSLVGRAATTTLWGNAAPPGDLPAPTAAALAEGRPVLTVVAAPQPVVWLGEPAGDGSVLWGALRPQYLFLGAAERSVIGGGQTQVCVFDSAQHLRLFCSGDTSADTPTLSARWNVFLGFDYAADPWRVEVAQPTAAAIAPVLAFRRTLVASLLGVLGLVVLLTGLQVRRSLEPLRALLAGTRRVAARDFTHAVTVGSRDEFGDLAASFNAMTSELDRQFRTLSAVAVIDQTALASPRADEVAEVAAVQLRATLRCRAVDVCLAGERESDPWRHVQVDEIATRAGATVQPTTGELAALHNARGSWLSVTEANGFGWLRPVAGERLHVLPLASSDDLTGLVAVHGGADTAAEPVEARQLADKVALGLSNARLIVRLNELSYGALAALARAVDASSHWTAGHSERVTACALRMADYLRLTPHDRDALLRGGLLHDIGKIGIPPAILDKPGPLEPQEMARIREHPSLGAQILSPLAAFADAIPVVLSHHERFDGTGYPEGLAGERIPRLARLLSVADVYDALVSMRPYRPGRDQSVAIEIIRESSGTQFDPAMVDVFLAVMEAEGDSARFSALRGGL